MQRARRKKWTEEDIEILKENYGKLTDANIADLTDKLPLQIYGQACRLGLREAVKNGKGKMAKNKKARAKKDEPASVPDEVFDELAAIGDCYRALKGLDEDAKIRVLSYLCEKLEVAKILAD